jgi:hypothetical protein
MSTQIQERQIADGAVSNAKIKAGAGIDTSKLAEGAEFIKRDGSVLMTGALNMNSQQISNLPTPSGSGNAATKGYVDTAIGNLASVYKYKTARAASTANVNVSNPGTAVFDGVTLVANDRILLKNQTAQAENGIYIFNGSGVAMTRATDADAWSEFTGCNVAVYEGTTNGDTRWFCPVNDGGTLNTTAITYTQDASNGLTSANFIDKEIPTGSINGSNTAFALANTPVSGSEHVFLNGILQESGAGNDYTISGLNITMLTAPLTGEKIRVSYRK